MLKRLTISNYALIDHLEIDLKDGLSIITGETGAGKSIIMGALALVMGQRADTKVIRDPSEKTVVEATFDISPYGLEEFFKQNDIDFFESESILRREIAPSGRTRAFINDTPVTLSQLGELTRRLIDIHSQHSNALLLSPSYQLEVVDRLAQNDALLEEYRAVYAQLIQARQAHEDACKRIEKGKADEEYLRFQFNQIDSAGLEAEEQDELERRKTVLENLSLLKGNLSTVCQLLNDSESSAVDRLMDASRNVGALNGCYDEAHELETRLDSAIIEIRDIYETAEKALQNLDDDAGELESVEERLSLIYSLQQKFRVNTVRELLAIRSGLKRSLDEIDNSEEELESLRYAVAKLEGEATALADKLTAARKGAAESFISDLGKSAAYLGLKNFTGNFFFERSALSATGHDKVRLMVSFNVNRRPMPIEETASGGEVSRLMLCIKAIIAEKMQLPTVIFDEIDTGVSGEIANKIGVLMRKMSKNLQVMAITHLPQVAAAGEYHYKVYKVDTEEETVTKIKKLDTDGRIQEIAGMLSGSAIDMAAIENAKSLMKQN